MILILLFKFCNFTGKYLIKGKIPSLKIRGIQYMENNTTDKRVSFPEFVRWWSSIESELEKDINFKDDEENSDEEEHSQSEEE
jgi:hypothetical protein